MNHDWRLHDMTYSEIAKEFNRLYDSLYWWRRAALVCSDFFLKQTTGQEAWNAIIQAREHDAANG